MHLPYTIIKFATSLDGFISSKTNKNITLSSDKDLEHRNETRSTCDGILIGGKTFRIDKPNLGLHKKKLDKLPIPIVMTNANFETIKENIKNLESDIVWILNNNEGDKDKKIDQKLIKFIHIPSEHKFSEDSNLSNKLSIQKVLENLYSLGIKKLLVEGGAEIISQFLAENCFDELEVSYSNKLLLASGRKHVSSLVNLNKYFKKLTLYKVENFDSTLCFSYKK